jgi:putative copper resistance protein D
VDDPLIYARAVHFAATLLAAGTVFFVVGVAEPAFRSAKTDARLVATLRPRFAWLVWISLAVAVLSGAAWLVSTAESMSGQAAADVLSQGVLWTVLARTDFGNDWLVRFVLAGLLAALFAPAAAERRMKSRWANAALVALAAGFAGSLAFAGHAIGGQGIEGIVHPAADILHLIAAAAWVGALVPLALFLAAAKDEASLGAMRTATLRFSALGVVSVATLFATGSVNSWYLVGGFAEFTATDYGRLLLIKIALFLGMVAIAAVNRFHLTPAIADAASTATAQRALRRLRRNASIEAAAGAIVIGIVAVLGTLPPASHANHHPAYGGLPPDSAFVHIHSEQGMADVMIEPGRVGKAHATVRLWTEDFEQLDAQTMTFTLTAPEAGSKPAAHIAVPNADGAWQIDDIDLSQAGNWTVEVDAVLTPSRRLELDAPIVIDPGK